jgi:transposase-like protein
MSDDFLLTLGAVPAILAAAILWVTIRLTAIRIRSSAELRCPNCGTRDVRHSHGRSWQDAWHRWFSFSPFRCRSCRARFYRYVADAREAMETD